MVRRRPYVRQRKRSMEFLWPFLLIIFVGIIVALLIQLVFSWLDQRETELKNKVYFYVPQGQANLLPWGETEWSKAYDGQLVLEGDELSTERSSRGVLAFYNGSFVRLDDDSQALIKEIFSDEDQDDIHLSLDHGTAWVYIEERDVPVRFIVYTEHLKITSYGTSFEVSSTDRETVRVMEGEVLVEVLDPDPSREVPLDQMKVGVGQQIVLTQSDYEALVAYESVSLLEALDDDWKESEWVAWNLQEDVNPSWLGSDSVSESEIPEDEAEEEDSLVDEVESEESEDSLESELESTEVDAPELALTFPEKSPYALPAGQTSIAITGTVSGETEKVVVTSYDEFGAAYPYTLQSYTPGDSSWQYNAAEAYDNLREGRNLFTVVAFTPEGEESEALEVVIEVEAGAFETTEEEPSEEESVEEEELSTEEDSEPSVEAGPLTTPQVSSLNGEALPSSGTYTTAAESVTIVGTVSASAVAVYVNDYQLSKFVAGSGAWSYYAREDFLNYGVGENVYTVYAEDAEGNKSAVLTFTIYREAP